MTFTTRITIVDTPSETGRIFPTSTVNDMIERHGEKLIFGSIGMQQEIALDTASHIVSNLRIEEGYLVGDVTLLPDTKYGKALFLIKDVVRYRLSGWGDLNEKNEVTNFSIHAINAVLIP